MWSFASSFQRVLRKLCHQIATWCQNVEKTSHSPVSFQWSGQYNKSCGRRSSPIRLTCWLAATCPKGEVTFPSTEDRSWAAATREWGACPSLCRTSWPPTQDCTAAPCRPARGKVKASWWGWPSLMVSRWWMSSHQNGKSQPLWIGCCYPFHDLDSKYFSMIEFR